MNFSRTPNTLNPNYSHQKSVSSVSQIQNISTVNIRPLAYPCRYHPDEICLNYCIEQKCFQALCSQCIEEHLLHHKKSGLNDLYVKSFKSVRSQCSSKLIKLIDKLLAKLGLLSQPKNPQEMIQDSDKQLQNIRILMHEIIDQEFGKIREAIKHKLSQNFSAVKELNQIHENLIKIINQLKEHNTIISEGTLDHPVNVGDSIEKTLLLNENALLQMFDKEAWKYGQKFQNINVEILFSQGEFRQSTLSSLKIGSGILHPLYKTSNNIKNSPHTNSISEEMNSRLRSRSKSPINQKSNDLGLGRKGFTMAVNYPVLHFFQTGQNMLHLIDLKGEPQKSTIQLGDYKVPAFHASLLSQKTGAILISGGNIQITENATKSGLMSKYSLISNEFKKDFAEVKPRSSHVLCEDFYTDTVYILGGYGETPESDHDQSITTFQTSVERVNLKNGNVEEVSPSNWGGACIAVMFNTFILKACMEGIQIYDSVNNCWSQILNVKGAKVDGAFCRGAGYSLLGSNSILIYGGYDDNQQSRKQSYLMSFNLNPQNPSDSSVQLQKLNSALPIAQGFWNNPGIIFQNCLWAIQNVEDPEGEPLESERTLLKLELQSKKWLIVKPHSKYRKN